MNDFTTKQPATFLCHITDTTDQGAVLKLKAAYARHAGRQGLRTDLVEITPAHSSLQIGTLVSEQVNNVERPDRLILAVNCAPPDKRDGTKDNARNDFYFAELKDNVYIGGTLNGYELSYVEKDIKDIFRLVSTNQRKSQFRSLEILPEHIVKFAIEAERQKLIDNGELERVDVNRTVKKLPDISHVIEVDNFGNVKWIPSSKDLLLLKGAQKVHFDFGKESIEFQPQPSPIQNNETLPYQAEVKPTLFAAPLGTNLVALSSSSRHEGNPVPMVATIRERPAETEPNYQRPKIGVPVILAVK